MPNFLTFSERSIKHIHKPNSSRFASEKLTRDYEILLFSFISDTFPHISTDCVRYIDKNSTEEKSFFDTVALPESEIPLFMRSLYGTRESTVLFPLEKKVLAVYNPLLRSNGLGIAFIFNYLPCYAPLIMNTEAIPTDGILLSPSFGEYPKRSHKAMAFFNSLMGVLNTLNKCISNSTASADSATSIMTAAADLIDIPITVELQLDNMSNRSFDTRTLLTLSIGLLSMAKALSANDSAAIKIIGGQRRSISVDFDLRATTDPISALPAAVFCERTADELRVPFLINIENGHFHSVFAPYREDPSLFGMKTGIFIDQKCFTSIH